MEITEVLADDQSSLVTTLRSWTGIVANGNPERRRQLRYRDRDYVTAEINSMITSLKSRRSPKEHYFAASHEGEVLAVMKVGVWADLILNHIVAKPKQDNSRWPGGASPVSALMKRAETYAGEMDKAVIKLNAEDASLIPLYFYYGYKLADKPLQTQVVAALGPLGLDQAQSRGWKDACKDVLAALDTAKGETWGETITQIAAQRPSGFLREEMQKSLK